MGSIILAGMSLKVHYGTRENQLGFVLGFL